MKLNEKIKNARKAAGLTQEEIAKMIGVKQPNYHIYESGVEPKLDKLAKIAEACKVDISYFIKK